jgi:hypothetical protein
MDDWWSEIDGAVLDCLGARGPLAPGEIGRHLGMSEAAVLSVLSALGKQGRIRICLVELASATAVDASRRRPKRHRPSPEFPHARRGARDDGGRERRDRPRASPTRV